MCVCAFVVCVSEDREGCMLWSASKLLSFWALLLWLMLLYLFWLTVLVPEYHSNKTCQQQNASGEKWGSKSSIFWTKRRGCLSWFCLVEGEQLWHQPLKSKYQILLVLSPYSLELTRREHCLAFFFFFVSLICFFKVKVKGVSILHCVCFSSMITAVRLNTNFAYCSSIWWNIQHCIFRYRFLNILR